MEKFNKKEEKFEKREKHEESFFQKNQLLIAFVVFFAVIVGLGFYGYSLHIQSVEKFNLRLVGVYKKLANSSFEIVDLKEDIGLLNENIDSLTQQKNILLEALKDQRDRSLTLSERLESAQKAVETFQKLTSIDEEILKKYSKIYFLSENYKPSSLASIDKKFIYYEDEPEKIHSKVYPFLKDMIEAAKDDDINLYIRSAYRSFDEQHRLKSKYTFIYGAGTANSFAADQGYSEHQLGTTVDFLTTGINGTLEGFGNAKAFEWLQNNAYKYGFILSYPKDNEYYVYEPWHWRFVGVRLATYLHKNNIDFYEMDQREIDEYLLYVFDR